MMNVPAPVFVVKAFCGRSIIEGLLQNFCPTFPTKMKGPASFLERVACSTKKLDKQNVANFGLSCSCLIRLRHSGSLLAPFS